MDSNFANNQENFKRESCLKIIIPFSIIACCLVVTRCSKKAFWMNQNGGAQAVSREGRHPWPHRSDGTGYQYKKWYLSGKFCKLTVKKEQSHTLNQGCKFELKPEKSRLFCRTRESSVDFNLNQVRPACKRRMLHISAVIPHFGYKYNNVIPHRTPKIWFIQRSTAKQEVNYQLAKSISIN